MKKIEFRKIAVHLRNAFPVNLIAAGAIAYGGFQSWCNSSGDWENVAILILLAVIAGVDALRRVDCTVPVWSGMRWCAWLLLLLTAAAVWFPVPATAEISSDWFWLLAAIAGCCYWGWRPALRLLPVLFLALLLLPRQEPLFLVMSYPLRLLSTHISVGILEFAGVAIFREGTTITVGGSDIAITDACSGISQLAVLAFLGYLLVRRCPTAAGWRILYYLCLLPVVIAANSIRIMLVVILFLWIGEASFHDPWHSGLGYFMVVLSVLLFWGVGQLLPHRSPKPPQEENHE